MSKSIVITGVLFILTAIILGAMGAHALEKVVRLDLLETFEKGVQYQFYAGFGLLIVGFNQGKLQFSLTSFLILNIIGVVLFSGCIYAYTFHEIVPALKPAVYLVPLGGTSMILAWLIFIIQLVRKQPKDRNPNS